MNSQQRKLSAILSVIFTLILVLELSNYQAKHMGAIADQQSFKLLLVKANDTIMIKPYDWLVAVEFRTNTIVGRGKLHSFSPADSTGALALTLMDKKKSSTVTTNEFNQLYIGRAMEVESRAGYSFLVGAGLGAALTTGLLAQDGSLSGDAKTILTCAGVDGAAIGLLGALNGAIVHSQADEYLIGENAWTLISSSTGKDGVVSPVEVP